MSDNPQQSLTHFNWNIRIRVKFSFRWILFKIALKESFGKILAKKRKSVRNQFVQRIMKVTSSSTSLCFAFRGVVERRQLWQRFLIHVHAEKWNFHATCRSSLPRIAKRIRNCVAEHNSVCSKNLYIYRRMRVLERVWITRD